MNRQDYEDTSRRLYRDGERGVILGVCAGLAEYFDSPLWLVRLGAIVIGWCFVVPAIVAYLVAALVLPQRPLRYSGEGDERAFWQSRGRRS